MHDLTGWEDALGSGSITAVFSLVESNTPQQADGVSSLMRSRAECAAELNALQRIGILVYAPLRSVLNKRGA